VKRLVWLLLFAFGTALAQVSPVDVRLHPGEACSCCDRPGACDMPDCVPAPVSTSPVFQASSPATVARAAKRAVPAPTPVPEKFYAKFVPSVSLTPARPAALTPAASVPLFREHCSLLL
jgi:hypothetical protein